MMGLDAREHRELERAMELARSGPLRKVMSRPVRLLRSKVLELWSLRCGRILRRTARTFWGEPIRVVLPDPVSLTLYRYGFFEEELTRIFLQVLRPGMTFFDVGSHFGYFSMLARKLVGPAGRIVAFEPTPSTREVLAANIGAGANTLVVPKAAYRHSAALEFHDFGLGCSAFNSIYSGKLEQRQRQRAEDRRIEVQAVSLDAFVGETGIVPDFLKIDTEGAELDVLAGMERLLTRREGATRPHLTLEVGDTGAPDIRPSREVVEAILAKGYVGLEVRGGQLVEHRLRDRYKYTNLLFQPAELDA